MKIEFIKMWSDLDEVNRECAKRGGHAWSIELDGEPVGEICPGSLSWDLKQGYSETKNPADYFEIYLEDLEAIGDYDVRHCTLQYAKDAMRKALAPAVAEKEYWNTFVETKQIGLFE